MVRRVLQSPGLYQRAARYVQRAWREVKRTFQPPGLNFMQPAYAGFPDGPMFSVALESKESGGVFKNPEIPAELQSQMFFVDKLLEYGKKKEYSPHIFIETPALPDRMVLELRLGETEHDLKGLMTVLLAMIVEKQKVDSSQYQSAILKPSTYPESHLLANFRNVLGDFDQLRGVVIDPQAVFISFKNNFNFEQLDQLIRDNPGGFMFEKEEGIRKAGGRIDHYSFEGIRLFSVTNHVLELSHKALAEESPEIFDLALQAVAELVSKIHNVGPYNRAGKVHYHEYVPIIRELFGSNFKTGLLGDVIEVVAKASQSGELTGSSLLVPTRKSAVRAHPEYRLVSDYLPSHIKFVLFKPAERKIVIGLDSPLDLVEIERRVEERTFFEHSEHFLARPEIESQKIEAQRMKPIFENGGWKWGAGRPFKVRKHVFKDSSGNVVLKLGRTSIEIDPAALADREGLTYGMLNVVYDNMLFFTNLIPDEALNSSLNPVEREIITAINNLTRFYNIFASMQITKRAFEGSEPVLPVMDWVLRQMREARTDSVYGKILFVMRKIRTIGEEDIPMIIKDNPPARAAYDQMMGLIAKLERLEGQ